MNDEPIDNPELEQEDWVSKTDKKRNSEDMLVVARSLMKLSDAQRKSMSMSDELNQAIILAIKIKKNKEAFRRQMQLISKILRQGDIDEVRASMQKQALHHKSSDPVFLKLEAIRDEMLNNGDEAVNAFLEEHPTAERKRLRQLIRQANKEAKLEKPLKSARELFQYIKSVQR